VVGSVVVTRPSPAPIATALVGDVLEDRRKISRRRGEIADWHRQSWSCYSACTAKGDTGDYGQHEFWHDLTPKLPKRGLGSHGDRPG